LDVPWREIASGTGGVPGTGGAAMGGAGGNVDSGLSETGGRADGSGVDAQCINLADVPMAQIQAADSTVRIVSLRLLDGPCYLTATMMTVEFHYWEKGYSCPNPGDKVTCEVDARSSVGTTSTFTVTFTAVPLSSVMLHWQPQSSQIRVTFPVLDGGAAGG
jgi:hypothetical protein